MPAATVTLVLFALWVGITDVRTRRIPNWLTGAGAASGLALAAATGQDSLVLACQGLVAGIAIGLLLSSLHALGAGDAKFMAAISAWAGWDRLPAAYLGMIAGGAAFALVWSARHRVLRATLLSTSLIIGSAVHSGQRLPPVVGGTEAGKFPYGVGLGLGAIAWWFWAGGTMP